MKTSEELENLRELVRRVAVTIDEVAASRDVRGRARVRLETARMLLALGARGDAGVALDISAERSEPQIEDESWLLRLLRAVRKGEP